MPTNQAGCFWPAAPKPNTWLSVSNVDLLSCRSGTEYNWLRRTPAGAPLVTCGHSLTGHPQRSEPSRHPSLQQNGDLPSSPPGLGPTRKSLGPTLACAEPSRVPQDTRVATACKRTFNIHVFQEELCCDDEDVQLQPARGEDDALQGYAPVHLYELMRCLQLNAARGAVPQLHTREAPSVQDHTASGFANTAAGEPAEAAGVEPLLAGSNRLSSLATQVQSAANAPAGLTDALETCISASSGLNTEAGSALSEAGLCRLGSHESSDPWVLVPTEAAEPAAYSSSPKPVGAQGLATPHEAVLSRLQQLHIPGSSSSHGCSTPGSPVDYVAQPAARGQVDGCDEALCTPTSSCMHAIYLEDLNLAGSPHSSCSDFELIAFLK